MKENGQKFLFEFNKKNTKRIMLIITFTMVLYYVLRNFSLVLGVAGKLFSVISPFIIGFCIAFIINMALRPVERLWDKLFKGPKFEKLQGSKRGLCLLISILLVIGIILAVFFVIIPEFKDTLSSFIDALPYNIAKTERWFSKSFDGLSRFGLTPREITQSVKEYISKYGESVINKTFDFTTSIFSAVANMVIGFVLSIYMLAQKETLIWQLKKVLFALFPEDKTRKAISLARLTNKTFTSFVSGQLTEAVIIGCLCFLGMLILRIPYAPVVSVLVGFTALIPVFGAFFGTAIGAFLILLTNPIKALWFVIFIIVLQQLEGNLIYPKVVGKSVGLPGIWVLAAVTVGGNMFGFVGMLICVPICSVLYTLAREFIKRRTSPEIKEKESE